jgi:hypothetical protein
MNNEKTDIEWKEIWFEVVVANEKSACTDKKKKKKTADTAPVY